MITKPIKLTLLVFLTFLFCACNQIQKKDSNENPRKKILFDFDWKFQLGDIENGQLTDLDDVDWRNVDLPHDWSIEDIPGTNSPIDSNTIGGISNGYFVGGIGWYRKSFEIPKDFNGKKLMLEFEGVYMNADVWLNGVHLGNHPYGYTAFEFEISDLVKIGQNQLAVQEKTKEGIVAGIPVLVFTAMFG